MPEEATSTSVDEQRSAESKRRLRAAAKCGWLAADVARAADADVSQLQGTRPHLHGEGLAGARLPVGEYYAVEAAQRAAHNGLDELVHVQLPGRWTEHLSCPSNTQLYPSAYLLTSRWSCSYRR